MALILMQKMDTAEMLPMAAGYDGDLEGCSSCWREVLIRFTWEVNMEAPSQQSPSKVTRRSYSCYWKEVLMSMQKMATTTPQATYGGDEEVVQLLLRSGADFRAQRGFHGTASPSCLLEWLPEDCALTVGE